MLCSRCRFNPEPEDQPINCVVLDGSPCSPCKERAAILRQIKQLEEEIMKLKAKHHALGTTMNAIHDPFIHKLPPEISSRILSLSLPTLDKGEDYPKALHGQWSIIRNEWTVPLKLGSVCRKWRQLAWATPDLWTTLYVRIKLSMPHSTAEFLPGLLREWLNRSGILPLTIYFFPHDDYSDFRSDDTYPGGADDWTDILDITASLVIDLLNSHSGRWRSIYLRANPAILERFSCSTEPKQLVSLELSDTTDSDIPFSSLKFMTASELGPTHLKLTCLPLTSINIRWEKITHATLSGISDDEALDFLRRAPNLEYYHVRAQSSPAIVQKPILHPQLRSLNLLPDVSKNVLDALTLPFLEEFTHDSTYDDDLPLEAMLSFLKRSGCCLKLLQLRTGPWCSADLDRFLQALPFLEHLYLHVSGDFEPTEMDGILSRIFGSAPSSGDISLNAPHESFLPMLQFMECRIDGTTIPPFTWEYIPQLYLQGHRQSLTLKCAASNSDISEETALRLLQVVDKGFDLRIPSPPDGPDNGDFLENLRNRMHEERFR
ncbi:hypothetical protein M413DRAFT_448761 [Hebeloma cylindrosporum]|uniref:Uncharacterized protein n=1 Tax=Hebeloma cylindrosporum TaxID=76867 RepID=A0A0C2XGM1_HEBCY|nr:hypothetical protein M413DRAFT_448761 [Hebeloma cylindrosporum h7]